MLRTAFICAGGAGAPAHALSAHAALRGAGGSGLFGGCARRPRAVGVGAHTLHAAVAPPGQPAPPPAAPPADAPPATPARMPLAGAPRYPEPTGMCADMTLRARASTSIPELFRSLAQTVPDHVAIFDEHHPGETLKLTYRELSERMTVFSAGLQRLGLREGDHVALFAENSPRWLIADQGIMSVGAAAAVRGVDAPVEELVYIYGHSESSVLVVEDSATLMKVYKGGLDRSKVKFVMLLYGEAADVPALPPDAGRAPAVYSFADVLARGNAPTAVEQELVMRRSDMATILYTSGTTGHPKGVVLSHGNILAQLDRISIGPIDPLPGEVFVSVLPCWHIFERTAAYYCFSKGMQVVYSNKRHFRDDLTKHRPHVLIAVPRVFENLHAAIAAKLARANERQKAIAAFFIGVSIAFVHAQRIVRGLSLHASWKSMSFLAKVRVALRFAMLTPLYALANLLVWRKIRAATGGRVKVCVCGGGTVPAYLEDFFEAAKITICVGYGLTETSPVISNRSGCHNVRGSAGLPLPGTEVRIVDQTTRLPVPNGQAGELLVTGPQVFSEYYRNPEATAKAFDKEGFFDTGDLAYIAEDGDVVITGRSKDVIVLSNGENIEPVPIEDSIVSSPLVDQIMLVGQDEKHLCALVVPSLSGLESAGLLDASTKSRIEGAALHGRESELRALGEDLVRERTPMAMAIVDAVNRGNRSRMNYAPGDRIQHIRLVLDPFTVENGMLTQTLKVKRNVVAKEYESEILALCRH